MKFILGYHHAGHGRKFWDGREFNADPDKATSFGSMSEAVSAIRPVQLKAPVAVTVYKTKNLLVDGEYNQVVNFSRRPDLLEKAHGTQIEKDDAVALIHWHRCDVCGLSAPRDHVSAQLILRLGLSLQHSTRATAPSVC